jgi:hypothetical protein
VRIFRTVQQIEAAVGDDLGTTDWFTVDQDLVTNFATLTRDHNWMHIDGERAIAGPFGGTIAHGYPHALAPALLLGPTAAAGYPQYSAELRPRQGPLPAAGSGGAEDPWERCIAGLSEDRHWQQDDRALHSRDRRCRQAGLRGREHPVRCRRGLRLGQAGGAPGRCSLCRRLECI